MEVKKALDNDFMVKITFPNLCAYITASSDVLVQFFFFICFEQDMDTNEPHSKSNNQEFQKMGILTNSL